MILIVILNYIKVLLTYTKKKQFLRELTLPFFTNFIYIETLSTANVPESLPLAIKFVATSLMVLCEAPDERIVATRQALQGI